MADLKKTSLCGLHERLGARMAPFGGWLMPVQYSGIIREHGRCREAAALFDTDHMGEFLCRGVSALQDIETLVSCRVASLAEGQCRYGLLCNPEGGVVDDLLVYRLGSDEFMLVVNAGTQANDLNWIRAHLSSETRIEDISAQTAKIDLQGPHSPRIIVQLLEKTVAELNFYRFMRNRYRKSDVIVSRTGYTGEMGFEIYLDPSLAESFWTDCMALGAEPAGLGARDTLRLEMGMPLYGHELDAQRNAGEAGFDRAIARDKQFIGSEAVTDTTRHRARLCGIRIPGRRAARHGDEIFDSEGVKVGAVTSGSFAPSLDCAVALGYVDTARAAPGTALKLRCARYEVDGETVDLPFYREATGRRGISDFL